MKNEEISKKCFDAITKIYGLGKEGSHLKKCDICGLDFHETNDLNLLAISGPGICPKCIEINELRTAIKNYSHKIFELESSNPIEQRNFYKDQKTSVFGVTSYTLDSYERFFKIENRTKRIQNIIKRISSARLYLYKEVEQYIQILESFFIRKDCFWSEFGNLAFYIRDAIIQFVVIKLKEFIRSDSSFCIEKIINELKNNKNHIFAEQTITEIKKFKKSGDILETKYPRFEIENYFCKINNVLTAYDPIFEKFIVARDEHFAHIDVPKLKEQPLKDVSIFDLKRIFNSMKIIYDGFLYAVAPDLYTNLMFDHNLWFGHLNDIFKFWEIHKKSKKSIDI